MWGVGRAGRIETVNQRPWLGAKFLFCEKGKRNRALLLAPAGRNGTVRGLGKVDCRTLKSGVLGASVQLESRIEPSRAGVNPA